MKDQAAAINPCLATLTVLLLLTTRTFASQFTVLHNFKEHPAAYPASGLIADSAGNLYGTTAIEGECPPLCGVVFELERTSSGWQYHVVHNFNGPQGDGEEPFGQLLIDNAGNLYGTTFSNGSETCITQHADFGTVFRLSRTETGGWAEKVLYRFKGKADGAYPEGNLLLDSEGNLFGSTLGGGSFTFRECQPSGCGVTFELSPDVHGWKESVLHSFTGGSDGYIPEWLTRRPNGNLLGVAYRGGTCCGTVFELSPQAGAWTLSVLYSFSGGSDGGYPLSGLILDSQGNIYGSASEGGSKACDGGCGTVFELSPNGSGWDFTDIYSFSGTDGESPHGILFDGTGNMFGVSLYGGDPNCDSPYGCGVLFKLVPSAGDWTETVLHKFSGGLDGGVPNPVVLDGADNLFGTAVEGGKRNFGTIFEFAP